MPFCKKFNYKDLNIKFYHRTGQVKNATRFNTSDWDSVTKSKVYTKHLELWLRDKKGVEEFFAFRDPNFDVFKGQNISLVYSSFTNAPAYCINYTADCYHVLNGAKKIRAHLTDHSSMVPFFMIALVLTLSAFVHLSFLILMLFVIAYLGGRQLPPSDGQLAFERHTKEMMNNAFNMHDKRNQPAKRTQQPKTKKPHTQQTKAPKQVKQQRLSPSKTKKANAQNKQDDQASPKQHKKTRRGKRGGTRTKGANARMRARS